MEKRVALTVVLRILAIVPLFVLQEVMRTPAVQTEIFPRADVQGHLPLGVAAEAGIQESQGKPGGVMGDQDEQRESTTVNARCTKKLVSLSCHVNF